MLESYPMLVKNDMLFFPEEIRDRFLATGPLPLRDGTQVTAEEIWEFMTEEGPRRFPYQFTNSTSAPERLPRQVDLISSVKLFYLIYSRRSRMENLQKQGKPIVYVQGGQPLEPYYAAETIPLRPGDVGQTACYNIAEGLNLRKKDWKYMDLHEVGNRAVSMEACHQIISHSAVRTGAIHVEYFAPSTRSRCSDVTFLVESHRDSPRRFAGLLLDYPTNYEPHKTWMVEYVASGVRRLVAQLDSWTGRTTTEEALRAQIRMHNHIRRLARETMESWRSAAVPPASSVFVCPILALGKDCVGDPVAAEHVLTQLRDEVRERVANSVKGAELARQPARVFKCGSCFFPNFHKLDDAGGVLVGADDWWSDVCTPDIEEEGDLFESYARATLAAPYDLPTEKRALWVVDQIKKSRADGVIFGYQWGCNFQSAVARLVCDIIQKEVGISTITLGVDELTRGETLEQTDNRVQAFVEMLLSS